MKYQDNLKRIEQIMSGQPFQDKMNKMTPITLKKHQKALSNVTYGFKSLAARIKALS